MEKRLRCCGIPVCEKVLNLGILIRIKIDFCDRAFFCWIVAADSGGDSCATTTIPMAMVGPLNAMPNTQLWARLQKEGRLQADSHGDNLAFCNFETTMPALDLVRGYRTVLATLYSPANFFRPALGPDRSTERHLQ